ncbi:hypothetical protein ACT7DM_23845 [Bacillus cereus]
MGSSGSMVKPISGFLTALIQYPVPVVESRADIDKQIQQIIKTIHSTKSGYPGLELIVFPEYSTQGLNTKKMDYRRIFMYSAWARNRLIC